MPRANYQHRGVNMKPDRQLVHKKCNGRCAYCGIEIAIRDMQVDHVIPQWRARIYSPYETVHCHENHMPSCRSCNNYKSGNTIEVFREAVADQIKVLRRDRPTFRLAERFGLIECKPKKIVFYFETLQGG